MRRDVGVAEPRPIGASLPLPEPRAATSWPSGRGKNSAAQGAGHYSATAQGQSVNAQTVNDILGHVSTGAFTALGLLSLRFWFQRRDRPSLWAALCFGTLTAVFLAGEMLPRRSEHQPRGSRPAAARRRAAPVPLPALPIRRRIRVRVPARRVAHRRLDRRTLDLDDRSARLPAGRRAALHRVRAVPRRARSLLGRAVAVRGGQALARRP